MLKKLNPYVRFIDKIESGRLGHESVTSDCRLLYVLDGSCELSIDKEKLRVKEKDVIYLPPCVPCVVRSASAASFWTVHFDLTCQDGENAEAKTAQNVFAPFDRAMVVQTADFVAALSDLEKGIVLPSSYARDHASVLMKKILLLLLEEHERSQNVSPLAKQIIDYVSAHYAEAEITNQEIASVFGYHPYHISRVMRKETGCTLKTYIIRYRLKVAANMLLLTAIPIADIASVCGFESQSYFSKMFREEFKITPGEYRKNHLEML